MNNNNNNTRPSGDGDTLSWLLILICLFAALPLGIILLLVKLSGTAKNKGSGSVQQYKQNNRQAAPSQAKPGQPYYASQPNRQPASARPQQYQKYQPQTSPSYHYYNVKKTEQPHTKEKASKKQSGKGLSALLMFLGILFLISGTVFLSLGIGSYAAIGLIGSTVTMAIFSALFYSSALLSFFERGMVQKRFRRFNTYAVVIGDRQAMPLTEISNAVGHSVNKTRKILQSMIDNGYFGSQAYIDSGLDSFVISREAADNARRASEAAKAPDVEKPEGCDNQYVAIINELHMLRAKTLDPAICEKFNVSKK